MTTPVEIRSGRITFIVPQALAVSVAAVAAVCAALVLIDTPSIVGLALVIGGSVFWCRWLERQQQS
jgi:hypothetical protein